jgi:hypothetical protein
LREEDPNVAGDRLTRILTELAAADASGRTRSLCEVAASVTELSGAGIMLLGDELPQGSLCRTDEVSQLIENLQYTTGEGPCVDAHHSGASVVEPDLATPALPRWQAFAPAAVEGGARAVFGFPIRIGVARLGALNLYRDRPGPLSDHQHVDARLMADVAARAILTMQVEAPRGTLASEIEAGSSFQFVVHQAAGMVSVQLEVSISEALVRLRAHAFRTDRPIGDVAEDVVARRLDFTGADGD